MDEAEPVTWRHRTRRFVGGRSRSQKVGGVAAVALLLTAPFGGLKAEPQPGPRVLQPGKVVDIGPFQVLVEKVVSLSDLAPAVTPDKGHRLLVVEAKVHNPHRVPEYTVQLQQAFYGSHLGVTAPGARGTYVVADASALGEQVNPGLTYEVALVWEQRGDWQPGTGSDRPTLGLRRYVFLADDPLTLDPDSWLLDRRLVQGHVDVEVKR